MKKKKLTEREKLAKVEHYWRSMAYVDPFIQGRTWKTEHLLAVKRAEAAEAKVQELEAQIHELKGTPAARFLRLIHELEQRFPDPSPLSAQGYEYRHLLPAIDATLAKVAALQRDLDPDQECYTTLKERIDKRIAELEAQLNAPNSGDRHLLNAYGRRCYEAGEKAAEARLTALRPLIARWHEVADAENNFPASDVQRDHSNGVAWGLRRCACDLATRLGEGQP